MSIALVLSMLLTISTLSAQFEKEVTTTWSKTKEIVKGNLYYQPTKTVIEVNEPIHQIMTFSGKVMTIFYPQEAKAFRIKAKTPLSIPFVQEFLQLMEEDYGLSRLGYKLVKHEIKADTLYTYWNPPAKQKKLSGMFILALVKDRLVYAELKTSNGKPAVRSFYKNYKEFNGKFFPLKIYSEVYSKSGLSKESVIYRNVRFNSPLPERILNFTIPDSISVKEIQW